MGAATSIPQTENSQLKPVKKKTWSLWKHIEVKQSPNNDIDITRSSSFPTMNKRWHKSTVKHIALVQNYHKMENIKNNWQGDNVHDEITSEGGTSTSASNVMSSSENSAKYRSVKPSLRVEISEDYAESEGIPTTVKVDETAIGRRRKSSTLYMGPIAIRERGIEVTRCMTNGGQLPHPHSFLAKGRLDFVHIGKLGSGNSGSVIEALHIPTLTIVALKMLPVYDEKDLNSVSSELNVLCQNLAQLKLMDERLGVHSGDQTSPISDRGSLWRTIDEEDEDESGKHPEITSPCPQLLAMYDDPMSGMVNLVVEYMDGGSLQDMVNNGGCRDEEVIADIAHQVLLGLDFLHSHNQMHRDIKPGNILLNCDGQVKLADFGISKAMSPLATRQTKRDFIGTVSYMAPERIQNKEYCLASDIWSFGMTLLAVVHGRYPLLDARGMPAKDYWDLFRLICEEDVPMPGSDFSEEFNRFIKSCVEKCITNRPTIKGLLEGKFFGKHGAVIFPSVSDENERRKRTALSSELESDIPGALNPRAPSCQTLGNPKAPSYRANIHGSSFVDGRTRSYKVGHRLGSTKYLQQGSSRMRLSLMTSRSTALLKGSTNKSAYGDDLISGYIDVDDDGYLHTMRLEHLKKILEKTSLMFDRTATLASARKKLKSQSKCSIDDSVDQFVIENYSYDFENFSNTSNSKSSGTPSSYNSDNSGASRRSISLSRSLVRRNSSMAEHLCKLPNCSQGRARWQHLAQQLYLTYDVVISTAKNFVSAEHFESAEAQDRTIYRD